MMARILDYFTKDGIVLFDELGRIQEVMDAWSVRNQSGLYR